MKKTVNVLRLEYVIGFVCNVNCNSITVQHVRKSGLLKTLIDSEKLHIVSGCESKQDSSITSGKVFLSNYEISRKDRISDNVGGGVFIAVHNSILATHESKFHCLFSNREGLGTSL